MGQFILASIGVFLVIILLVVTMLLIAKKASGFQPDDHAQRERHLLAFSLWR